MASPFDRPNVYPVPQQASPQSSSTASSAYTTSSGLSSLPTLHLATTRHEPPTPHYQATNAAQASSAAPLPSPALQQTPSYFSPFHPQRTDSAGAPVASQQAQHSHAHQHQRVQQQHREYKPNRDGAGATAPETNRMLREYSLVAEAAKRAQMAVLTRDMDGMEMS